ncbi:MAG: type VI secretion system contractile sheath large subunit, partial [Coxiella sp. (in: Bacteria)]
KTKQTTTEPSLLNFAYALQQCDQSLATCPQSVLDTTIHQLDTLISAQLDEILHAPDYLTLAATWIGSHELIDCHTEQSNIKLKFLSLTQAELNSAANTSSAYDKSYLYQLIYDNEFNMPGGEPFDILIGDYYFDHNEQNIVSLTYLSHIASSAVCPFIAGISPTLFKVKQWADLHKVSTLSNLIATNDHIAWRELRASENSKFIVLAAPCYLGKYTQKAAANVTDYCYNELIQSDTDYCWVNAAFAQARCILQAYNTYGWCTAIRGREGGGQISRLPLTRDLCATQTQFTDSEEHALSQQGIIPLCHYKNTNYAVIFACDTLHQPKRYDDTIATSNAKISARLPYILATSRFAHYLKVIARDKIGTFMDRDDLEHWLNTWISQYVNANAKSRGDLKARFPLAEASVQVHDDADHPGRYQAIIHLKPWLQLEELSVSLRLVTDIPKSRS